VEVNKRRKEGGLDEQRSVRGKSEEEAAKEEKEVKKKQSRTAQ
jgi:hypothetical protein